MAFLGECKGGATYLAVLFTIALGCWSFFIGIYFAGGTGVRRWKGDDERFAFGMLGVLFTILALLPFDPLGGTKTRHRNLFHRRYREGCWPTLFEYFRHVTTAAAGAFNLYNAAAMGTDKTGSICDDARYAAPAIASVTYMATVLPAGHRVRAVAVSLPITALLTLLILHTDYIDSDAPTNRLAGSVVAAVVATVVGLGYITIYTITAESTRYACHGTAKGAARFLEILNSALAATFGWFYWHQGWSDSLDPPFEKWIIPVGVALTVTIARFVFFLLYFNIPIKYKEPESFAPTPAPRVAPQLPPRSKATPPASDAEDDDDDDDDLASNENSRLVPPEAPPRADRPLAPMSVEAAQAASFPKDAPPPVSAAPAAAPVSSEPVASTAYAPDFFRVPSSRRYQSFYY